MYPTSNLLGIVFNLVDAIIGLLIVILVVNVVISWLYAFDVVTRRNAFVRAIWEFTSRISDPLLRPLRRLIPPIAGVDLSVLILLLVLQLLVRPLLAWLYLTLVGTGAAP